MIVPPVSWEFALLAIAVGTGASVSIYMSGRHNRVMERVAQQLDEDDMDQQMDLLDAAEAISARNAILEDVSNRNVNWLRAAASEMARLPDGTEATGEGFRKMLLDRGIKPPLSPNAWGALTMNMTRRKVLVPTGERRPMLDPKGHGRSTDVYVKCTPESEAA